MWDKWFSEKLQNIDKDLLRVDKLKEKVAEDLGSEMATSRECRDHYLKPMEAIRAMCFFGLSLDKASFEKVWK